jgi:hypothetical protein
MAAGDKVQIGKAFKVEFGSFTYAGYQPTSITNTRSAEVTQITDTRGATVTHIINNPGKQITITCYVESTGSVTPPSIGDFITLTPPEGTSQKYILASSPTMTHSNNITTLSMTLTREDSMAATYDA